MVQLLDEKFLVSSIRNELDSQYRFPTAVARQLATATSVEDEKLRQFTSSIDNLELNDPNFLSDEMEFTKFDDEVQMGFEVQLLTPDLIEQYPQLDPSKRTIKVNIEDEFFETFISSRSVLSNAQSTSWSMFIN